MKEGRETQSLLDPSTCDTLRDFSNIASVVLTNSPHRNTALIWWHRTSHGGFPPPPRRLVKFACDTCEEGNTRGRGRE